MSYCSVEDNKEHLINLLRLIQQEVLSAGGDGDTLWYSRFYDVHEIKPLIKKVNAEMNHPWEIIVESKTIHWGTNQEWAIITNDEQAFNSCPDWVQMKIRY
jgi:hypothetical protein